MIWLECPLWVISGHRRADRGCPLCPRKRTFVGADGMSAKCHKRTFAEAEHAGGAVQKVGSVVALEHQDLQRLR